MVLIMGSSLSLGSTGPSAEGGSAAQPISSNPGYASCADTTWGVRGAPPAAMLRPFEVGRCSKAGNAMPVLRHRSSELYYGRGI